ncbi:hypothetical protein FGIG_08517 [Fasciola gigantica]|uniref:cardiolipin synthase (CMP-forming) n=1 Tax=Fasciola gigantica TaxID=46835 RepID=A0A504Z0N2_FASGI|nr:hypothetical protein FGIG_08517 [Fasciola gigantica]
MVRILHFLFVHLLLVSTPCMSYQYLITFSFSVTFLFMKQLIGLQLRLMSSRISPYDVHFLIARLLHRKCINLEHHISNLRVIHRCAINGSTPPKQTNELRILTVPNVITTGRIICCPMIAHFIITDNLTYAVVLATVVGLSDVLDGAIARSFPGQKSIVGSYLDPMADKILVTTLVISMAFKGLLPGSLVSLIICRDLGIITLAGYLSFLSIPKPRNFRNFFVQKRSPIEMKASNLSKFNTFCQLSGIVAGLIAPLIEMSDSVGLYVIWSIAATTTICSGLDYLRKYPQWKKCAIAKSSQTNR